VTSTKIFMVWVNDPEVKWERYRPKNQKWKCDSGATPFFIFHFSFFISNEKWKIENGCSFSIFHFPFAMKNEINGMYTDPAEIDHIETWARTNNLTPNRKKSTEIIFVDTIRKRQNAAYPPLPGILRVTSISMSPSPMVRQRPIVSTELSLTAHRLSMHWESCALTACVIRPCRPFSDRLSLPNNSTRAVLGGVLPMRQTGSESMRSLRLLSAWLASIRRAVPGCRPAALPKDFNEQ
jgi:hypothetical protein